MKAVWSLLKDTVTSFIDDDALSRGAAMAFYAGTSLAPILLIVVAIAGLAFGQEAARHALAGEFESLMGHDSAVLLQGVIENAGQKTSGVVASLIGLATLGLTASGMFGEMQSALNVIWKTSATGTALSRLLRARAASAGLVAALGFLLLISLAVSAALTAMRDYLDAIIPFGNLILSAANAAVSFVIISVLFAAIYKVLPDRRLEWRDVAVGAVATTVLFLIGKSLIGWYLGASATTSTYGAAGSLIIVMLWIYYSSQIFLLGAEFTKAYATRRGGWGALELRPGDP